MDGNLGEFPKFLVVSSRTESDQNTLVFAFSLLLFAVFQILHLCFRDDSFGVGNVFMVVFLDEYG
jgi:hypothetical protein